MVNFHQTMGGFDVLVDGKLFGRLQKGRGFFTDPAVVKEFLVVSPQDLNQIASKANEVKNYGEEAGREGGVEFTVSAGDGIRELPIGAISAEMDPWDPE